MKTLGMLKSRAIGRLVLCTLILMLGLATTVYGCACCAEPGTWFHENRKSDKEVLSIVGDLQRRLGGTAALFVTGAGVEDVRGIDRAVDSYTLRSVGSRAREWKLEFVDEKGNRGTLSFIVPSTIVSYGADPGDVQGRESGPLLYKEWRLQGRVTGSGIFKRGVGAGARFRLVLQGRGNMCAAAEDFKSWILQVNGPRADFSFHGQFKQ